MCLNDDTSTRIDMVRGNESAIDLTIATKDVADKCSWEVLREGTIGSDHYPVVTQIELDLVREHNVRDGRWILRKADWDTFSEFSECGLLGLNSNQSNESLCSAITSSIINAADATIPETEPKERSRVVPWWSKEFSEAIRDRNKAFRNLKNTHHFENYKRYQGVVRRTIKNAKKEYWMMFCDSIGRTTPIQRVWGMVKKMRVNGKEFDYPVLIEVLW